MLDLNSTGLGNEGAEALAGVLPACTSLDELRLQDNEIGDAGAMALAKVFLACTSLIILDLEENKIGETGKAALRKVEMRGNIYLSKQDYSIPLGPSPAHRQEPIEVKFTADGRSL